MVNFIKIPNNAICLVGGTGAGKTFILHSYLSKLADLKVNKQNHTLCQRPWALG